MIFYIEVELYRDTIIVAYGEPENKVFDAVFQYDAMQDEERIREKIAMPLSADGRFTDFGCGIMLLRINEKPIILSALETLQHEITHCMFAIMNRAGVEYCKASEEAFTYLNGYLTRKVHEKIGVTRKNAKPRQPKLTTAKIPLSATIQ